MAINVIKVENTIKYAFIKITCCLSGAGLPLGFQNKSLKPCSSPPPVAHFLSPSRHFWMSICGSVRRLGNGTTGKM